MRTTSSSSRTRVESLRCLLLSPAQVIVLVAGIVRIEEFHPQARPHRLNQVKLDPGAEDRSAARHGTAQHGTARRTIAARGPRGVADSMNTQHDTQHTTTERKR